MASNSDLPVMQQKDAHLNIPKQNAEAEQGDEWILIGGQKVKNFGSNEKYYRESDIESITSVSLHVNLDSENQIANLEGIERLENLKGMYIYLYGPSMDRLDYSPLNALQNIEWLYFECPGDYKLEKIPDLRGLASCNKIKRIKFDKCALINVDNIEFLPNISSLLIVGNYAGLSDLKSLNRLSQLEELFIHSLNKYNIAPWAESFVYSLDEESLFRIEEFSSLNKLKQLTLYGGEVDARGIEQLNALEEIVFNYPIIIKNQQYISGASSVRRMEITISDQEPNVQFLGRNMANLEELTIYADFPTWGGATEEPYQILDVAPIGDIPQLKWLELRGFILKNLEALDRLENMYGKIFVRDCVVTDKSGTTKWELLYDLGGR